MTTNSVAKNEMNVRVVSRQSGDEQWFEGTVIIVGLQSAKLVRKSDGSPRFSTRSSLTSAANNLAKNLGFSGVSFEEPRKANSKTTTKVAAKKKPSATSPQS